MADPRFVLDGTDTYRAFIGGWHYELSWRRDADPDNEGWWLSWRREEHGRIVDVDGTFVDGPYDAPNWREVSAIAFDPSE